MLSPLGCYLSMPNSLTTPCPDEDTLVAFVTGHLDAPACASLEVHLDGCAACRVALIEAGRALAGSTLGSTVAPAPTAPRPSGPPLPRTGERVGRYIVIDALGQGAMGVVFSAFDPELARKVAIKLVRVHDVASRAELEARLMREAQAMARLSHRNVVAVYDIGTVAAGVWIAMELVSGVTLRQWLKAEARDWRSIVDAFLQAGDGLAAAHEADIVHRDFKPDNVLVDASGRVLVTDFGLAHVDFDEATGAYLPSSDLYRTRAGTLIGTPAYMAPEQLGAHAGEVDPRADVFAFGVSLYEALFGQRPYEGRTLGELERALARGEPLEPPPGRVPRWVRRAVMRAVAARREDRVPSMSALLSALRADPKKRLVRVAVPALVAAIGVATIAGTWHATSADARACRAGAQTIDRVWSDDRRVAARDAFLGSGSVFAADTFPRVSAHIDARMSAWADARVEACDATHERGEQSETLLDLRLRCLDQRRAELEALTDLFTRADATLVKNAQQALANLPPSEVCADAAWLEARVPPPTDPDVAALVALSRGLQAKALAQHSAGQWREGAVVARFASVLADTSGHLPVEAEATVLLARILNLIGAETEAEGLFRRAIAESIAAGDDRAAALAHIGFAKLLSVAVRKDEALYHASLGQAHITRLGGDDRLMADLLAARAEARLRALEPAPAVPDLERAVALLETHDDNEHAHMNALGLLAWAQQQLGHNAEAIATYEKSRAVAERAFGPDHPLTVSIDIDLGTALAESGLPGPAVRRLEPLVPKLPRLYGELHWNTLVALDQLALPLAQLGRFEEALALQARTIAAEREVAPQGRAKGVYSYQFRAKTWIAAGHANEALADLINARELRARFMPESEDLIVAHEQWTAHALEIGERFAQSDRILTALEPRVRRIAGAGPSLAITLVALARADVRGGRPDQATARCREALAMLEPVYGADNLFLVEALHGLGSALLAADQRDEARRHLTRALAILDAHESNPLERAEVSFALARVEDDGSPAGHSRARALVDAARANLSGRMEPRATRLLRALDEWREEPGRE